MINFNKALTSKIISLMIVAVSFFMTDASYAGAYSQRSLRVPMGEKALADRMKKTMEMRGGAQASVPVASLPSIRRLVERLNATERTPPKILSGVDAEINLRTYLERMRANRTIEPTQDQERRLRKLFREYLACERMIHFVDERYVSINRIGFLLSESGGTMLPARTINQIMMQDERIVQYDFVSAGVGYGMGSVADSIFDTPELVSTCQEDWAGLRYIQPHENAGIAVVLKPEAFGISNLVAVNVPDAQYLDRFHGGPVALPFDASFISDETIKEMQAHVLSLESLNQVREELLVCGGIGAIDSLPGMDLETFRVFVGKNFGPLSPREVMIPEGVGPRFIEKIVVSNKVWDKMQGLFVNHPDLEAWWRNIIVRESDYVQTEPRVLHARQLRVEIENLLSEINVPAVSVFDADAAALNSIHSRDARNSI